MGELKGQPVGELLLPGIVFTVGQVSMLKIATFHISRLLKHGCMFYRTKYF